MTKQIINLGTPDKGNGDPLRIAFSKVNENFTELYNSLGLELDNNLNLGAFEFTGNIITTTDSTSIVIDQATTVASDLTVGGNLVPQTANGGDLGSLDKPWRSLYVSNSTVYLGGIPLSVDANNNLTVNGSPVTNSRALTGWTVDVNNHLVPNTDILQDIGTPTQRVRHVYVGPGSITIGSSVITESSTGKLVLPGITRGVNYTIDEVEEKGDQNYEFEDTPVVIDAAYYDILRNVLTAPQGYRPPEYAVDDMDDGEIDGINVVNGGAGLDQTVANKMRERMRAYIGSDQDPINNFSANDWIVIPFTVSTEAADVEYETGGADTGNITFTDDEIGSTTNVVNINANDYAQLQSNENYIWVDSQGAYVQIGSKTFEFDNRGVLRLPADGDIVNSSGQSVLGGGSNSYTPEDSDLWDNPTVNTVQAALDELAAKVAALQNFEIDGGNAYTPAAGELLIDGNGA